MKNNTIFFGCNFIIDNDSDAPHNGVYKGKYVFVENGIPYVFYDFDKCEVHFNGANEDYSYDPKSLIEFVQIATHVADPRIIFK